ncbi:ubiquitin-like modifier-activating enzyme ATG7 [Ornithodoros turicata]|uniref:ubiquitin-like modifier-activating enzyme ATG7 n=1 Tax=Ornithodoros turicata TaxID=34597 RepID=UPI003139DF94
MGDPESLQYVPFASALDTGFWYELTQRILNIYRLDDSPVPIWASYSCNLASGLPALANLDYKAFQLDTEIPPASCPLHGFLCNMNTLDAMKEIDKAKLMKDAGDKLWEKIQSGDALRDPSLLVPFFVLTFADIKKYHYYYWFAFPAVCYPGQTLLSEPIKQLSDVFTDKQMTELNESYSNLSGSSCRAFFVIDMSDNSVQLASLSNISSLIAKKAKFYVCFSDPSTNEKHPGWPLRNLISLLAVHWGKDVSQWQLICYRRQSKHGQISCRHSLVLSVHLADFTIPDPVKYVGWERNVSGQLGPRMVNLSNSMDPVRLSESAVDLNLKLMRWRLAPSLELEYISATRCLLLGSGTLGCNVARGLMGWGVRNITFVDNSKVSYSNPVRQSLYKFEDCQGGGKHKAEAAALALKEIFPVINSKAVDLTIPMPGHSVPEKAQGSTQAQVARLEELIAEHDVIFLLLDTREARWLPTLLGAAMGKIVINAAVGFDTFLVMRHGVRNENEVPAPAVMGVPLKGDQLGCYFCNDVVGPTDSTRDRTLDQQCTVTRPGISMMAAAMGVELLINILQHPLRGHAPAENHTDEQACAPSGGGEMGPLGVVPHQIRCFFSRQHYMIPSCASFHMCTACSPTVISEYKEKGFDFLLKVFNDSSYLEEVTGLSKLHADTDIDEVWALSDSESQ